MKKLHLLKVLLSTSLCVVTIAAQAACERHIYNNSGSSYSFTPSAGIGNVWYYGAVCNNQENGTCVVPAHTTIMIKYTTTGGYAQGHWNVTGPNFNATWNYSGSNSVCPYISHSGDTGAVSVNAPANGDMTADR